MVLRAGLAGVDRPRKRGDRDLKMLGGVCADGGPAYGHCNCSQGDVEGGSWEFELGDGSTGGAESGSIRRPPLLGRCAAGEPAECPLPQWAVFSRRVNCSHLNLNAPILWCYPVLQGHSETLVLR